MADTFDCMIPVLLVIYIYIFFTFLASFHINASPWRLFLIHINFEKMSQYQIDNVHTTEYMLLLSG